MGWYPGAIRKIVKRHRTPMARHRGLCLHIAVSEGASLFNYFDQDDNPTSHFYVRYDGDVEQYVDTQFQAPANLQGNPSLISIETQGGKIAGQSWTVAQRESMAGIAAWVHKLHGIPLVAMPDSRPATRGIGYHRLGVDPYRVDGGELWSKAYGKTCPQDQRIAQIPEIIRWARIIVTPPTEEDSMATMTPEQITALIDAVKRGADASEETAQLLRTHAVRMDYLTNNAVPKIGAALASLLALEVEEDADTDQIRADLAAIRETMANTPDPGEAPS